MRTARRRALALALTAVGAAGIGALVGALVVRSGNGAARLLSASYPDLDGRPRRIGDWGGRVLLCNFWATWCAPCREEIPLLVAAKQQYAKKAFEIIGIGIDQGDKIREFAAMFGVNYPMLVAGAEAIELLRTLGNAAAALPYTVILDRSGEISSSRLGAFRSDELQGVLSGLLG